MQLLEYQVKTTSSRVEETFHRMESLIEHVVSFRGSLDRQIVTLRHAILDKADPDLDEFETTDETLSLHHQNQV